MPRCFQIGKTSCRIVSYPILNFFYVQNPCPRHIHACSSRVPAISRHHGRWYQPILATFWRGYSPYYHNSFTNSSYHISQYFEPWLKRMITKPSNYSIYPSGGPPPDIQSSNLGQPHSLAWWCKVLKGSYRAWTSDLLYGGGYA